jgi:hypothetical protein
MSMRGTLIILWKHPMETKPLPLKIALADRGIVQALRDGHVRPLGITVEHIQVDPIIAAMRRMVRGFEFDACEMALSTYVCARTYGKPLIAIPVFISRNFHHRAIFATSTPASRRRRTWRVRSLVCIAAIP